MYEDIFGVYKCTVYSMYEVRLRVYRSGLYMYENMFRV